MMKKMRFIIPEDFPKEVYEAYKRRQEIWENIRNIKNKNILNEEHYVLPDKFTVKWRDGEINPEREIEFIPQEFMIDISKDTTKFNKLLQEIIAKKNMENLKPYDIYSGRDVRYAEWDMLNDYIAPPDGNMKDWKLISRIGYFSNQNNRVSFEDRTRDKIITLMNTAGIGIYASNVTEEGNVFFEMMPITDFNSSLKINEKKI